MGIGEKRKRNRTSLGDIPQLLKEVDNVLGLHSVCTWKFRCKSRVYIFWAFWSKAVHQPCIVQPPPNSIFNQTERAPSTSPVSAGVVQLCSGTQHLLFIPLPNLIVHLLTQSPPAVSRGCSWTWADTGRVVLRVKMPWSEECVAQHRTHRSFKGNI